MDKPSASSYDAVPYRDYPYPFTHPRHLETIGTLFGMSPADIRSCRVLELGCAAGGNLIPQAEELSSSRFLGIDLSARQVHQGQQLVRSLGLENVELRQANILDIDDGWGEFDYIISHGVFSWLPPAVQDKLLSVSCRNLSPRGVAFVSYNTYPGWHLGNVVRDLMRYHTADMPQPRRKIDQAMAILRFVSGTAAADQPIGRLLRDELTLLEKLDNDSYIFHEHLESDNHPLYFHEFVARAEAQGLQYLGDAEVPMMLLRNLPAEAQEALADLPVVQQEQYMDFVRARRFRKSLVCHQGLPLVRRIGPQAIVGMHIALASKFDPVAVDLRTSAPATFKTETGTLEATNRLVKAAVVYLREIFPRYASFAEVAAAALARLHAIEPPVPGEKDIDEERLACGLLLGFTVGFFELCVHPPRSARRPGDRPQATALARWQADRGPSVTNWRHRVVTINPLHRRLLRRLDGQHDRGALENDLQIAAAAGEITLLDQNDKPLQSPGAGVFRDVVNRALSDIAAAGLLVA